MSYLRARLAARDAEEAGTTGKQPGEDPFSDTRGLLLKALDFDPSRCNARSARTLLALLGLKPVDPWSVASRPLLGTKAISPLDQRSLRLYQRDWQA